MILTAGFKSAVAAPQLLAQRVSTAPTARPVVFTALSACRAPRNRRSMCTGVPGLISQPLTQRACPLGFLPAGARGQAHGARVCRHCAGPAALPRHRPDQQRRLVVCRRQLGARHRVRGLRHPAGGESSCSRAHSRRGLLHRQGRERCSARSESRQLGGAAALSAYAAVHAGRALAPLTGHRTGTGAPITAPHSLEHVPPYRREHLQESSPCLQLPGLTRPCEHLAYLPPAAPLLALLATGRHPSLPDAQQYPGCGPGATGPAG